MPAFLYEIRIVEFVQVCPKNIGMFQLYEVTLVRRKNSVEPSCDVGPVKRGDGGQGALEWLYTDSVFKAVVEKSGVWWYYIIGWVFCLIRHGVGRVDIHSV